MKKVLFVIPGLDAGGGEKALVNLLNLLDAQEYEIDLLLFSKSGLFLEQVPETVNIITPKGYYADFSLPMIPSLQQLLLKGEFRLAINRIRYSKTLRKYKNPAIAEQQAWKYWQTAMPVLEKEYDVAIGFLEKSSIYYVVDKVKAKKKIGWIHTTYGKSGLNPDFDSVYFGKTDKVVTVSEQCLTDLHNNFLSFRSKFICIENLTSKKLTQQLSDKPTDFEKSGFDIVTVARLSEEKGMYLLLETFLELKIQSYDFKWYVIGDGPLRNEMESFIIEHQLCKYLILIGLKSNPYPYIKQADIYCQPSKHEGKSIAIDEAKLLAKPILATNFSTVADQLEHLKTGYIVEMNPKAIAEGIIRLYESKSLRDELSSNLLNFDLETEKELQKIEHLVNG